MSDLMTPEQTAQEIKRLVGQLQAEGRSDLLLKAIGVPLLEELRIEAAKSKLSRLVITEDYRFLLIDYNKEVELQPVHKAVYMLFLAHPEGIEFKHLVDRSNLRRHSGCEQTILAVCNPAILNDFEGELSITLFCRQASLTAANGVYL